MKTPKEIYFRVPVGFVMKAILNDKTTQYPVHVNVSFMEKKSGIITGASYLWSKDDLIKMAPKYDHMNTRMVRRKNGITYLDIEHTALAYMPMRNINSNEILQTFANADVNEKDMERRKGEPVSFLLNEIQSFAYYDEAIDIAK